MIRMPAFPVGKDHDSRSRLANHARDLQAVLPGVLNPPIRNVERAPPEDAKDLCCIVGFASAIFGGAARAEFALGQVKNPCALPALRRFEQCAAAGLFYVVAVGGDSQNIESMMRGNRRHISLNSLVLLSRSPAQLPGARPFPSEKEARGSHAHRYRR